MSHPTQSPDFVPENEPDTIATPEGDNEDLPGEPLTSDVPVVERPRGNEPHPEQPLRPAED